MKTPFTRISLLAATLAAASLAATAAARAGDCYGCYDDPNGNEQCKTVEVQGSCDVISFCKVVGCNTGRTDIKRRLPDVIGAPPQGFKPPSPGTWIDPLSMQWLHPSKPAPGGSRHRGGVNAALADGSVRLTPAAHDARAAGKPARPKCSNNVKQIGIASH